MREICGSLRDQFRQGRAAGGYLMTRRHTRAPLVACEQSLDRSKHDSAQRAAPPITGHSLPLLLLAPPLPPRSPAPPPGQPEAGAKHELQLFVGRGRSPRAQSAADARISGPSRHTSTLQHPVSSPPVAARGNPTMAGQGSYAALHAAVLAPLDAPDSPRRRTAT